METDISTAAGEMLLLISGWIFLAASLLAAVSIAIRKLQTKREKEVLTKFKGKRILRIIQDANFFGQESLGYFQLRGNGILVVTEEELYFEMWYPEKKFRIPLSSLLSIETTGSHLGKTRGRPLLKVIFRNGKGRKDSMAWLIADVNDCRKLLEGIMSRRHR